MARTTGDVPVIGRSYPEVRGVVQQWISSHGLNLKSETPGRVVASEGSIWLFGEKVFEISILPQAWGAMVHTEGYMPDLYGGELDMDPGAIFGGLPRRAGYRKLSDLWARLRAASLPGALPTYQPPVPAAPPAAPPCSKCGTAPEFIPQYGRWFCRKCFLYV